MSRRQRIIISISGIFLVTLILTGLTYAHYLTSINGNLNDKSITVTTSHLELTYTDGNGVLTPANMLMPGEQVKFLDGNKIEQTSKTFSVTNNGDDTEYVVFVDNINVSYATTSGTQTEGEYTTFESNDFRYTLTCMITSSNASRNNTSCSGVENGTFPLTNDSIMVGNDIKKGDVHNYVLTMEYLETGRNQTNDMNKTLSATFNIEDTHRLNPYSDNKDSLAYNIINNARLKANGTDLMATPLSTPAKNKSDVNEKVLSTTEDNYGTSYYFRGNVSDNYVTFSELCWRIVRIQGDGSIKLTLESLSPCSENMTSDFGIGTANWGTKTLNGNSIGNYKNSTTGMKNKLTTWLNATDENGERINITANAEKLLKTEDWCLGNIINTYNYSSPHSLLGTTVEANYLSDTKFYFETGKNLYGKGVTPNATLICNGDTDSSKIGALTADEVAFAGGKVETSSYNYYLQNDSYNWWTLSSGVFNGTYVSAFRVRNDGSIIGSILPTNNAIRPAVSLNNGVTITSGEGTLKSPYVIAE